LIAQKTVVLCPEFLTTDPKQIPDYPVDTEETLCMSS